MAPFRVAVGSLRAPKLEAVRAALSECARWLSPSQSPEIEGFETPSGVRSTPLNRIETMQGARNRAEALAAVTAANADPYRFFVGLEGGLEVIALGVDRRVFLESWVYVLSAEGRGHYGQSGAVPLPDELAVQVVDQGIDLSDAIDAYARSVGIRDDLGAWGVLTHGLIKRQDAFRIATINAFSPFFEREMRAATAGDLSR
jgi:non-canonical (house-cleaning) NTP pyrophosphatase